jgi:hypothetical protein
MTHVLGPDADPLLSASCHPTYLLVVVVQIKMIRIVQHVNEMLYQVMCLSPRCMVALFVDALKMRQLHPHTEEQISRSCFLHLHTGSLVASG